MEPIKPTRKVNLGSAILGAVVTLIIGIIIGTNQSNLFGQLGSYLYDQKTQTKADWSGLNEVYNNLVANYDGEINFDNLLDGARAGMVAALGDPFTNYMTASEAEAFNKSLSGDVGAGVGIEMALRDGYVRVLRTLPDNPARKAGVLAGDIIYKVNDEEVYALSTEEIAAKLRGEAGTTVKLTVVRDGAEKSFDLKREKINNVSAYVNYSGTTAILTITRFDLDTGTLVSDLVKEFPDHKVNKVILDLRGNGGGYTSAAKDLLSLWLDGDKIYTQKSIHLNDEVFYAYHDRAILKDMKTIVLVNDTTASAAEITAGALQDYDKATIVGTTTYGKGVVQVLLDLSAGSQLKVTSAHWYTPNDVNIAGTGIKPDVEVTNTYDDTNHGRDPQLDKAKSL